MFVCGIELNLFAVNARYRERKMQTAFVGVASLVPFASLVPLFSGAHLPRLSLGRSGLDVVHTLLRYNSRTGNQHGGQLHRSTTLAINHPLDPSTHGDSALEETCSPLSSSPLYSLSPPFVPSFSIFINWVQNIVRCIAVTLYVRFRFSFRQFWLWLHLNYIYFISFVAYFNFLSRLSLVVSLF